MEAEMKWYVGALNDGLFITDQKPSPAGTDIPPEWGEGCGMALNVTALSLEAAQAIVDAHNRALEQPDEESRAITALKVTLFGIECWLPSGIAKAVQAACEQPASAAVVPEGWVLVPVRYANDADKKIGWTLDMEWAMSLVADSEYAPGMEETEAVILALIAATPSPPVGEKGEG